MYQTVRVPKAAELIVGKIRRQILLGRLREGDPLPPESEVMEEFGVSRPTLREAYRILESEQLISVRRGAHGGGRVHTPQPEVAARHAAFVLEFQGAKLREIFDAGAVLEAWSAGELARKRTKADLKRLRAHADISSASQAELLEENLQFHRLVVDLVGNRAVSLFVTMSRSIRERALERYIEQRAGQPSEIEVGREAHTKHMHLADLIEAREAEQAEKFWKAHVDEAADRILSSIGSKTALEVMF